jgi:hypothetical protein
MPNYITISNQIPTVPTFPAVPVDLDDVDEIFKSFDTFVAAFQQFKSIGFESFPYRDSNSLVVEIVANTSERDDGLMEQLLEHITSNGIDIKDAINEYMEEDFYLFDKDKCQNSDEYLYTDIYDILYRFGARFDAVRWNRFCDTKTENLYRNFGSSMDKYLA